MPRNVCLAFAALASLAIPAASQSVISTRAGLIHYFEGAVSVDGQRLQSHLGTFPLLEQGGELRTYDGKAEVLLTPDVFLRIGDKSFVRMVSNNLADTQVELEGGSAIIDAEQINPDTSASILFKNWRIHFLAKGVYRIDSDPPRLLVTAGEAEVFTGSEPQPVSVAHGMNLPLAAVLVPDPAGDQKSDALSEWSKGRDQSITSDNAILAELDQDPGSAQDPLAAAGDPGFTYYPMIGLMPPLSPGLSPALYSSLYPFQPGFNSIYLPGYTYLPLFVGFLGRPNRLGTVGQRFPIGRPIQGLTGSSPRPLVLSTPRPLSPPPMISRPTVVSRPPVIVSPRPPTPVRAPASVGHVGRR